MTATILPEPLYTTRLGAAYHGDALDLLGGLDSESIDLVVTSPPFPLLRQKEYGNKDQDTYVDWIVSFAAQVHTVLKDTGSFVLDLGGAYKRSRPVRSLYNYRVLIRLCDELGFKLAEEFFWFNPAKLPSPIEWVNKRKIRVKDAVNTVWWLSKTDWPKADVRRVLKPYSQRMEKLLREGEKFYTPKLRPSGHDISKAFTRGNAGAIPPNLLSIPNTESNSLYLRLCRELKIKPHPARFPEALPRFFIDFLTEPGDIVADIFAGSNATGVAAEKACRSWLAFEEDRQYLAASCFRFLDESTTSQAAKLLEALSSPGGHRVELPQATTLFD